MITCQQPIIDHRYLLLTGHINSVDHLLISTLVDTCAKTLLSCKLHDAIAHTPEEVGCA